MASIEHHGPGGASKPDLVEALGQPVRSAAQPASLTRPWQIAIVATACTVLVLKILLALKTYGTNDVYAYERFSVWSGYLGVYLYRADPDFNHPPLMIHVLRSLGWLANSTGLPFPFWLRLPGILADLGSLWIVWKLLGTRAGDRSMSWALLLLATAPSLILISGFHGNTDTVMIFFLLLSVYLIETGRSTWLSGAALGLSVSIKVVPLIVVPVIFLYLGSYRKRLEFFAATGAVILLGWSPFIFQDPWYILTQVFGYKSIFGVWGLSWLLVQLWRAAPGTFWLTDAFSWLGRYVVLGLILLLSLWMNRFPRKPPLFSQIGIIFLAFLSLSNGFGVQYLAWPTPWVVWLGAMPTAIFFMASGAFLFLVYNYWAQGFPWYLAESGVGMGGWWQTPLEYFQVVCWLSVVVALWAAWQRIRAGATTESALHTSMPGGTKTESGASAVSKRKAARGKQGAARAAHTSPQARLEPSKPLHMPVVAWRLTFALFAAALVVFPIVREVPGLTRGLNKTAATGADSIRKIRAEGYLVLSSHLLRLRRFQDTITAARVAAQMNPNSPDAYTYLAGAYVGLRMWDKAIESAREALRINPDSAAAQHNLAWVLQEMRLKGGRVGG